MLLVPPGRAAIFGAAGKGAADQFRAVARRRSQRLVLLGGLPGAARPLAPGYNMSPRWGFESAAPPIVGDSGRNRQVRSTVALHTFYLCKKVNV